MRRHHDENPSFNTTSSSSSSSSGVSSSSSAFNTSPLPLSVAAPSNSRISDLNARAGIPNIPLTSSSTGGTLPSTPNYSLHHQSSRILSTLSSAATASSDHSKLTQRQPLALIQETVHAVGAGTSEMQSGVQFSLQTGYQGRVATATAIPQNSLSHSQPAANLHHSLPSSQTQAHNVQVVHPVQTNSQQAHATQMQGTQFQRLKVEDALSYLDQVKYKFGNQPQVYNDFLDIMKEFKSQSIDTPGVIQRVSNLFRGHPELIVGFNTFLPPGYRIEVQSNEQVQVSIPGTNLGAGGGSTGPTSLTIHPTGPPSTPAAVHPPHSNQSNHSSSHSSSPHPSPGGVVNKSSTHPSSLSNSQSHPNSQSQHSFSQNSPAHTSSGGSPSVHSPSNAPQASQPVEFNHAINYVNKIKNRFQGQPDIYKQFLEILHTYQKEQRNLKDGVHIGTKPLTEAEVYAQVAKLFQNQEDLLQEFGQFLPDANGAANALVGLQPPKSVNSEHNSSIKKASLPTKSVPPATNQPKQIQTIKRPISSMPSPPIKKPKMTSLKDITLAEAGKYGTLNEYAFFDKVRKALKSQEIYENFLRCLAIYNQEVISRTDLVLLVAPFLTKFPDLYKWFKDFLGYKESYNNNTPNNNLDIIPKKVEPQERERLVGEFATEIDYSSCKKYGASYRAVPRNYVHPRCSGRTSLCREVLNDTWVSFPSWSEDSTFVSSRKTQFEEYIYRCEDERYELDVVLETTWSVIKALESELSKMNRMSGDEKARYRLDETLGGSSAVLHQRTIKRVYGEKATEIIEGLKTNPSTVIPLVVRRLRLKEEEWRKAQKNFNKVWKEQNEKYYLKSLDHQGINFKQNDVKNLRSKSILNEIETLYEERHEQIEDGLTDIPAGPHIVVFYKNREIFKDAADILLHHVKRQSGIHKEDKNKIRELMRHFFPEFFSIPYGEIPEDDDDKDDDDMETEDGIESPKGGIFQDFLSLKFCTTENTFNHSDKIKNERFSPPKDEKSDEKSSNDTQNNSDDTSLSEDSYALIFGNNNWYIFFRLHHTLCERLWKIHERSQTLISEELRDQEERKKSTALALRLKPKNNIRIESYYSAFLEMIKNVLDNNLDTNQYEDNLREMFGINAYLGFTLDKVIQNAVRQLQHIVGDEACTQWTNLYLEEQKNRATGGPCATASQRAAAELAYQKRAEQMMNDENCFKIIVYKQENKLTIELLDSDTDLYEEQNGSDKWNSFIRKYTCEDILVDAVKERFERKPLFLPRTVNCRRHCPRFASEEKDSETPSESDLTYQNIQDELDDSKIDLSRLEDGCAGEAVRGLVGLNAKAKYLKRTRQNKALEGTSSTSKSGCRFDVNSFKMLYIVNSESFLYKKRCLRQAQQAHPSVTRKLNRRWHMYHKRWVKDNVSEEQEKLCRNWLLGLVEDSIPTNCISVNNLSKPPYCTYNRYIPKVRDRKTPVQEKTLPETQELSQVQDKLNLQDKPQLQDKLQTPEKPQVQEKA